MLAQRFFSRSVGPDPVEVDVGTTLVGSFVFNQPLDFVLTARQLLAIAVGEQTLKHRGLAIELAIEKCALRSSVLASPGVALDGDGLVLAVKQGRYGQESQQYDDLAS